MATKKTPPQIERQPTQLKISKEEFRGKIAERIQKGEELINLQTQTVSQLEEAKRGYSSWDDYNSELLKQSFNNEVNEYRKEYNTVNFYYSMGNNYSRKPEPQIFREKLQNKITELRQLEAKIDLMKSEVFDQSLSRNVRSAITDTEINTDIFIVHGHNNEIKSEVARLSDKIGLNPIILHEQANGGKTIIEKFEQHSNVGFAIILLTDDDLGKTKTEEDLHTRARQNVILELGYFIGKLGRERICPLYVKGVELPNDLSGILYTDIDEVGHWKYKLAKELKEAGYNIDMNLI